MALNCQEYEIYGLFFIDQGSFKIVLNCWEVKKLQLPVYDYPAIFWHLTL